MTADPSPVTLACGGVATLPIVPDSDLGQPGRRRKAVDPVTMRTLRSEIEGARAAPPSRTQWLLLSVALAANALILAHVAIDLLNAEPPVTYRPRDFVIATLVSMAIFCTLLT